MWIFIIIAIIIIVIVGVVLFKVFNKDYVFANPNGDDNYIVEFGSGKKPLCKLIDTSEFNGNTYYTFIPVESFPDVPDEDIIVLKMLTADSKQIVLVFEDDEGCEAVFRYVKGVKLPELKTQPQKQYPHNQEFYDYYNSINHRSIDELEYAHDILVSYAVETIPLPILELDPDQWAKKEAELGARELPEDKKIWGCRTYGDASKMNKAIVKRINELDVD